MSGVHWTERERRILTEMAGARATDEKIAAKLGRSPSSVREQRRSLGLAKFAMGEPPAGFADTARGKSLSWIVSTFRCSRSTATKWRRECGIAPIRKEPPKPGIPDDFAARAPTMTFSEAAAAYGRHWRTVKAWYTQTGIAPRPPKTVHRVKPVNYRNWTPASVVAPTDSTLAGFAAQHLRRVGYSNVHRATVLDRAKRIHLPQCGAEFYFVAGRGFMHQSDMIDLARSLGLKAAA